MLAGLQEVESNTGHFRDSDAQGGAHGACPQIFGDRMKVEPGA